MASSSPQVDQEIVESPRNVTSPASRFRFRFGLRSILAFVLFCGAILFLWIAPSLQQGRVVDLFHQNNMVVEHSPKPFFVPQWLYEKTGPDFFSSICRVDTTEVTTKNQFPFITKLEIPNGFQGESLENSFPNVNTVTLHNPDNVQFLVHLKKLESIWDRGFREEPYPRLPSVTTLMAGHSTELFDCNHVNSFPNLRALFISAKFKNGQALANNPKLESLNLGNYVLSAGPLDLTPISKLSNLKQLMIHGFNIGDLSPLQELSNLEQLEINGASLASLEGLYSMKQLKKVVLGRTFTPEDEQALTNALPDCEIIRPRGAWEK